MYLVDPQNGWNGSEEAGTDLHTELCAVFAETCKVLILIAFSREAGATAVAQESLTNQIGRLSSTSRRLLQEADGPALQTEDEPTGVAVAQELAAQTRRLLALLPFPPAAAEIA